MRTRPDIKVELKGRWASVLQSIGFPVEHLNGKAQGCYFCAAGKDRSRYDKNLEVLFCSACGHRPAVDVAMEFLSLSYKETAKYLRPNKDNYRMTEIKAPDTAKNRDRLIKINGELKRIDEATVAAKYFAKRGISITPDKDCHYHSDFAYWEQGEDEKWVSKGNFPAIVSKIRNKDGQTISMHIIYMDSDGNKLNVGTQKKILPPTETITGGAIRLYQETDVLAVTEGIENALSVYALDGIPVWAAGNANNMANLIIPDSVKVVHIYPDNDESGAGYEAAFTLRRKLLKTMPKENVIVHLIDEDRKEVLVKAEKYDYNDFLILQSAA